MTKDAQLVGAADAREVWNAYFGQLAGYCAGVLADRELGRDVAAEAFVRLWARWTTVEHPRAFLYAVATNLCRDHWRRAARERRAMDQWEGERATLASDAVDPWLRDLVDRLPEKLRQPVLLHYYADLPVAVVARVLHRPEGTVKSQLVDARRLLGTQIEESK